MLAIHRLAPAAALLFALAPQPTAAAQIVHPDNTLEALTPQPSERFGENIAVDGDRMVVGAPRNGELGVLSGAAYFFERAPGGDWVQTQKLFAPIAPGLFTSFGTSVAIDGDRALVSTFQGYVAAYERGAGGNWNLDGTLDKPSSAAIGYGTTVALEGDRAVVACTSTGLGGFGPGELYVFERGPGGWVFDATIQSTANGPSSGFGITIDLDGDQLVAGAAKDPASPLPSSGLVHLARRNGPGDWSFVGQIAEPVPEAGAEFGTVVALDAGRLFVGAIRGDGAVLDGGEVHEFVAGPGGFAHVGAITSGDTQTGDRFGSNLAFDGDLLVVGAEEAVGAGGVSGGAAYLFGRRTDGSWFRSARVELESQNSVDDIGFFAGTTITVEGDAVLLGAPGAGGHGLIAQLEVGTLLHGDTTIASTTGGAQSLSLRTGAARAGDAYLVVGSATGTTPGTPLGGGATLPLVVDPYTLQTTGLGAPIAAPLGVLGPDGEAESVFFATQPVAAAFVGLTVWHAALTFDLVTFEVFATNAVAVELVP